MPATLTPRLRAYADELDAALADVRPVEPFSARPEAFSVGDAYRVQAEVTRRRVARGARLVGHKVGLTSAAVQAQLGVSEPDFGALLSTMEAPAGSAVALDGLLQPRVEGEIAFVLKTALQGPGVTADDVLAATAAVCPAIEVIDSRVRDWKIAIADTIADGASSARFALGPRASPAGLALADLALTLTVNGETVGEGTGAASLGDPALAVAFLANRLAEEGEGLDAGHVVLSGALAPVYTLAPGDHVCVAVEALGEVSLHFPATG